MQHAPVMDNFFPVFAFSGHGILSQGERRSGKSYDPRIVPHPAGRDKQIYKEKQRDLPVTRTLVSRSSHFVLVSDFHFQLPDDLIAQQPLAERDSSRMLQLKATTGQWSDHFFREFPELLRPGDLMVFNNT